MVTVQTSLLEAGALIVLEGRMDAESRDQLQAAGDRMVEAGAKYLAVDMTRLTYISSAGLGVLVRLSSIFHPLGGRVWLCGANGVVSTVLEITKIGSLFRMCATVEEAIAAEAE